MAPKIQLADLELLAREGGGASGPRSLFTEDVADEFVDAGETEFAFRYGSPVLVMQGLSGQLKDEGASSGTMVVEASQNEQWTAASMIGRVFPVRKPPGGKMGPITIGRTADNDVVIPEYSISKRHCLLRLTPYRVTIEDVGSTNGTEVAGAVIIPHEQVVLSDGMPLALGRFRFNFLSSTSFRKLIKEIVIKRRPAR